MAGMVGRAANQPLPFGLDRFRPRAVTLAVRCADLFGEDPVDRVAYLTLFRCRPGAANLFVYRALNDLAQKRLRDNPSAVIASPPGLAQFTGALGSKAR